MGDYQIWRLLPRPSLIVASDSRPTRGRGLLEKFIARYRMRVVLHSLKPSLSSGEVLDIGCGTYPLFLLNSPFSRKVGVDQMPVTWTKDQATKAKNLEIVQLTLVSNICLPFPDASFGCVTSLACIEHLDPTSLLSLAQEIYRILKPGGQVLITTPHAYAKGLLRLFARLGLVSKKEIEEHKSLFLHQQIRQLLENAGFAAAKIKIRAFQLGLNILAVAEK
jgi:SAM-dependent methyltransferase